MLFAHSQDNFLQVDLMHRNVDPSIARKSGRELMLDAAQHNSMHA